MMYQLVGAVGAIMSWGAGRIWEWTDINCATDNGCMVRVIHPTAEWFG